MSLHFKPLQPLFGAEASGVEIRSTLPADAIREIEAAMDRYAVLLFRGQPLNEDQQIDFTRQFGPLELGFGRVEKAGTKTHRFKYEELADMSNVDVDGNIRDRNSRKMYSMLANQLWHSDSSFQKPPARFSMLYSVTNPPGGGDTEFADLRAAYDALPSDLKALIQDLSAEHSALHSRINHLGYNGYGEEEKKIFPPVQWPLVRTHPGSGRKLLFIGVHASHVVDMHLGEGRLLLAELLEHATQREFVYRHRWQVGDLVIWDNRCTLHRGMRYDLSQRRELRRSTTGDVPNTVAEPA